MGYILDKLTHFHKLENFSCGVATPDRWLKDQALNSDKRGTAVTYVWHNGDNIVTGYFSLSMCSVDRNESLPRKIAHGSPRIIPSIVIGKLALDESIHGQHLGKELLYRAFEMCDRAAQKAAARLVIVDALNEEVAHFYERYGFVPFMDSNVRLARKLSDIRKDLTVP